MIALLVPAAVATALVGPSFVAVSRISRARSFAPLVRGSLERICVLADEIGDDAAGRSCVAARDDCNRACRIPRAQDYRPQCVVVSRILGIEFQGALQRASRFDG